MIKILYIEKNLVNRSSTKKILKKFKECEIVICEKYTDVFNKKSQNFRIQKRKPSLILANKKGKLLNKIPKNYSIGGNESYYFSHMLNCIYDCKYCFLQGMFNSANFVLFTNFEDFKTKIKEIIDRKEKKKIHFFSGYDCDSLAMESLTGFANEFVDFFSKSKTGLLELRTKSTAINTFLSKEPNLNTVIAYSLSPDEIIKKYEDKTPSLKKRINAIKILQSYGWRIGLRFDPIIYIEEYKIIYESFFKEVFFNIDIETIHSATVGTFRMPNSFFKRIEKYNIKQLKTENFETNNNWVTYKKNIKEEVINYCSKEILNYIPKKIFFIHQ